MVKIKVKREPPYVVDETILVKITSKKYLLAKIVRIKGKKYYVKYVENENIEKYGNKEFVFDMKDIKKYTDTKNVKNVKVKIKLKDEDKPINPVFWVLQNKKRFPSWINETFIKYKLTDKVRIQSLDGKFKPFKYQLFLRDYMQKSSPYRGVLLYHGLGSGKTCSAVTIAENLKLERNIVVILPASLKDNFVNDGLKFCGDPQYRNNPKLIDEKYTFISSNASNTIQQLNNLGNLDDHIIIIDEVHNLVSRMVGGLNGENKQGKEIYDKLMAAKNCKIIALTGTPIINNPYEITILYNILRGFIYLTTFRISYVSPKYGETWNLERLEDDLKKIEQVDYFDVNKRNKTIEFHLNVYPWEFPYKDVIESIIQVAKNIDINLEFMEYKTYTLFPDGANEVGNKEFEKYFIDPAGDRMKNKDLFKRRVFGLTSYYRSRAENFPKAVYHDFARLDMSPYQFGEYEQVRKEEKQSRQLAEIRIFSRQYSNFVFPVDIPRPGIGEKIAKKGKEDESNAKIAKIMRAVEKEEELAEIKVEEAKRYKKAVDEALAALKKGASEYLKKDLGKYSLKMKTILDNIEKTNGLVFVYSDFRTLEGVGIFALVLEANGYAKFGEKGDQPKFAIYSGTEDFEERSRILRAFTSPENKYGKNLKIILATSAGAEGLDLKNIRQVHIMEPYWNEIRVKQVVGRAVRRNSHIDLPEKERVVEIFRYLSVIPDQFKADLKPKEQISTDEFVLKIAKRKELLTEEMVGVVKDSAVDCVLNKVDNDGTIKCYSFGEDLEGLAYYPRLETDLGSGIEYETREVEVQLRPGIVDADGIVYFVENKKLYKVTDILKRNPLKKMPKIKRRITLDLEKREIYDYEAAKKFGTKVKIGHYNDNGEYYKK